MKTIQEIIDLSTQYLSAKNYPSPRRQVEELLAHILKLRRLDLYMDIQRPLEKEEVEQCRQGLMRLAKREPVQHLFGEVDFFGCKIKITPDVLIPRHETEIFVDKIAQTLEKENLEEKKLWDLCCGSGCIGLALKKRFPKLDVTVSDLSEEALSVAKENAALNNLDIKILHGDLLAPFKQKKADYIVCNPPYIADCEYGSLDPEVRDYEPKMALLGGVDGLDFYRRLAGSLKESLCFPAKVWMEIGHNQGKAVKELFFSDDFSVIRVEQDWSGHDRFFSLEIS